MGLVYEAFDRHTGRHVALKTMRAPTGDALLRFKQEFRSLQGIHHPNLVSLGDLMEEAGQWWFSMELVHGVNFLEYVRSIPTAATPGSKLGDDDTAEQDALAQTLSPEELSDTGHAGEGAGPSVSPIDQGMTEGRVRLPLDEVKLRAALKQLVEGLHTLHIAQKVHRDIKPDNVLVCADGRVVVLDFGLVGDDLAPESAVIGTIAYMAPEQAAGRPVGASADWYSMGVLLYEALVGRPPFMGKALEVLADKQSRIPPRPSQIARQLPQDLDALCMDLLRTEPGKRPDYPEILRRLQPSLLVQTEIEVSGRCFVGRSAELEKLSLALAETRRGQPRTILLHGESGVGKSALMRHFAHLATTQSAGLVVLTGRCYEHESVPFKAIDGLIDNLARLLRKWPEARVASILPRRVSALLQAFPVLGMVPTLAEAPSGRFAPTADPHEQRLRVFAALRELLGRLAERQPLLIMIDDLQWTDGDSLALLANLMSPPDEPPLMLVATVRLGTHVLRGTWLDIERAESAVHHIRIDQLPHSEALILAQALAGPSSSGEHRRLQRLVEEARGHPLFIQELVRHTLSHGTEEPPRLDDTIWARIGELAEPAQRLLRLCAVMGSPLPVDVATQASSLLPEEVERALIQLRAANLLRASLSGHEPDSGARDIRAVEPYHDRIRELVSERLPPEGRQECHQRLAQALEKTKSTDPEALTYHFSSAGETDKAGPYALQAGDKAATTLAFERAARFYGQALEWLRLEDAQRRDLLIKRANALANAGHEYQASKWLIQAAETAEPEVASDLRRRASDQLLRSGHHREGVRLLRD